MACALLTYSLASKLFVVLCFSLGFIFVNSAAAFNAAYIIKLIYCTATLSRNLRHFLCWLAFDCTEIKRISYLFQAGVGVPTIT